MSNIEGGESTGGSSGNSAEQGERAAGKPPMGSIMGDMARAAERAALKARVFGEPKQAEQAGGEQARGELRRVERERANRQRR